MYPCCLHISLSDRVKKTLYTFLNSIYGIYILRNCFEENPIKLWNPISSPHEFTSLNSCLVELTHTILTLKRKECWERKKNSTKQEYRDLLTCYEWIMKRFWSMEKMYAKWICHGLLIWLVLMLSGKVYSHLDYRMMLHS